VILSLQFLTGETGMKQLKANQKIRQPIIVVRRKHKLIASSMRPRPAFNLLRGPNAKPH
jgi:hypothetical protein